MSHTVAIHQPNHLPWLGYFAKMARADLFVFLDDVQYSKGSYINRVQVAGAAGAVWLTAPVSFSFGDPILAVNIAKEKWASAHRDKLHQLYRSAAAFRATWPEIEQWLLEAPSQSLTDANIFLVSKIANRLGLRAKTSTSSRLGIAEAEADDRLAAIVDRLAPGGKYLSGSGGANYQSNDAFASRDVTLIYSDFKPASYDRGDNPFVPGLSILDSIFHVGWDEVGTMIAPKA